MTDTPPPARSTVEQRMVELLPRLRRFCLALSRSPDDGDDLAQATFERALKNLAGWQEGTGLDSWMFKIAQNIWIDGARARKVRGTPVGMDALESHAGGDMRQEMVNRALVERTRQAMDRLPDDQRILVASVLIDGMAYKEAADMLDIPIGTVMSRVARARRALESDVFGPGASQEGGIT